MLTLIPKTSDARNMKNFRPISLANCSFKIFSKVLSVRLGKIAGRIILNNQSAFIKGRYILESVVTAHEIVHSVSKKKKQGIILKLDYEKAYDRVNLYFLFDLLKARNFNPTWINWMKKILIGGSVGVNLNGEESSFFKTGKGLRQGDPISPMLFNLVGDVFARLLLKAANQGMVQGLLVDFRQEGVLSLQYADDTIVFSNGEEYHLKNLKCCLVWFECLSGMRINYHKSEIVPINVPSEECNKIARIFSCPLGGFPIKYLGVPLHYEKLRREDVQPLVDKILKKIASWRGKLLSHAAKLTLIRSCLASILVYLLSFIKFPKWAIKILNSHMSNCLWNDSEGNHKYHLVSWDKVSMCREYGGLGIPNLRDLNCLLAFWIKRCQADNGKLWKEVIDFKYRTDKPNIFYTNDNKASPFFRGFMWAAKAAKMGYRWKIGNGHKIKFWEDVWLGSSSLAIQFWDLYVIVNEKTGTVRDLWDGVNLRCTFRRTVGDRLEQLWLEVLQLASTIEFFEEEDSLIWQFSSNGSYSSQSLYKIINHRGILPVYVSAIWDLKIPPCVHFFLWLLAENKNLTRDNLGKRREVTR
jgi:hypothetical protein